MAINLSFGVGNIKGAPGIISDITANKPGANIVADGTIFIDQTLFQIEQSIGGVWVVISGGGGGGGGIDTVLAVGQPLTATREIDTNGNNFQIYDFLDNTRFIGAFNTPFGKTFQFGDNGIGSINFFNNTGNPYFTTFLGGASYGITARYDAVEISTKIGEFLGLVNGTTFVVNDTKQIINTQFAGQDNWLSADNSNLRVRFGDYAGIVNSIFLECNGSSISIFEATNPNGFSFDFPSDLFKIGQITNGNYLELEDHAGNNNWNLYNGNVQNGFAARFQNQIFYLGDFAGQFGPVTFFEANASNSEAIIHADMFTLIDSAGQLLSGSAGGSSGQHLIIKIDGNYYKIQLLNP